MSERYRLEEENIHNYGMCIYGSASFFTVSQILMLINEL